MWCNSNLFLSVEEMKDDWLLENPITINSAAVERVSSTKFGCACNKRTSFGPPTSHFWPRKLRNIEISPGAEVPIMSSFYQLHSSLVWKLYHLQQENHAARRIPPHLQRGKLRKYSGLQMTESCQKAEHYTLPCPPHCCHYQPGWNLPLYSPMCLVCILNLAIKLTLTD